MTASTDSSMSTARQRRPRRAHLPAARAAAGALLALAALLALPAHAQTIVDADWGAIPSDVAAGTPFRLLFVTSEGIACTSTDISTYNSFVQGRAGAHIHLSAHSARFKAVASTAAVDAKVNTGSSGSTVAIYWLGGAKAAANGDFYNGTLDSYAGKTETGGSVSNTTRIWTGSNNDGTAASDDNFDYHLGASNRCNLGRLQAGDVLDYTNNSGRSNTYRLYALSSVFQARSAPAAITDLAAMAGVGKVTLSWTEPDDGGSGITGYKYRQRISSGTTWDPDWTEITGSTAGTDSHVVTGLAGGTSYTFEVQTKNAVGYSAESNQATATPTLPAMSIAAGSGGEATGRVVFPVSLNATYHQDATATWSTANGTAMAGSDYTAVTGGTLTVAAGSTSANITVTVTQDTTDEKAETFTVTLTLSGQPHATLATATATGTIADDDPSVVSITAGSTAVTEGSPAVFELSRGIADDGSLAVNLSSSSTPTGAFITATLPTSATIAGGAMSTTLSIATVDDEVTEPDGSVTVTIQANTGVYAVGDSGSATVNIRDNDASYLLNLDGGGTVTEAVETVPFTVTLSESPRGAITVQWEASAGTAKATDFTAAGGTLSFAAGATGAALTQEFTVAVIDDSLHEADEQFTVTLSNATGTGATIGTGMGTATVTIDDDDVPELSIAPVSANENGGTIGFPVSLSLSSDVQITVNYATSPGTATASDFTAANGTMTFAHGVLSRTISVHLVPDTADEDNETFTVTLSSPTAAGPGSSLPTLNPASAQGTIVDDDGAPLLSIDAATAEAEEDDESSIHFVVSLDPASAKVVSASWSTADITATAGSDYTAETGGMLTIARGDTSTTVSVDLLEDDVDEPPETFTVTLSNPVNGKLSAAPSATGTILDDDLSTVSITAVSTPVTEGSPAAFELSRGIDDDVDLVVVLGGSKDDRFIAAPLPESATIPSGASTTTVSIATDVDEDKEDDGSVTVTIQADDGYTIGTASATVAIQDDDVAFTLDLEGGGTVSEADGSATLSVTLTLSEESPTEPITVQWATADGTATSPADYTAVEGALTFATDATGSALTQQITVTIEDDNLNENDEAFTVTLSNAGGMGAIIGTRSATVTITDNEATPVLSIADATAAEDARGGVIRFPVTLNPGSGTEVTVDYATSDGTAEAGSDFTDKSGTLTFAPGATARTISISLLDEAVDEADETFTVTLSNASSNAELASNPAAEGTIVNDDGPVEVTVGDVSCPESAENRCNVSVDLDKTVSFAVVLNLNTANDTATGGTAPGNVFAPGDDFKIRANRQVDCVAGECISPDFRIHQDQIDEEDETFTYTVTLVGDPDAVIVRGTGTVTIEDDDPPSSVGIADGSAEEHDGTISFVVSLDHESGKQIGVAWATADGTAVAGQDYQATSAVVDFAPGVTTQTIGVAVIDDSDREPDGESFQVTLSRAAGTETDDLALGDTVATGTINASDLNFDPTGAPTITGPPPTVGVALAVDTSAIADADGLSGATYDYQWMVDDGNAETDIAAATAAGYTPRDSDVGKTIRVRVTFTDDNETEETLFSAPTETVAAAPPAQVTNVTVEADVGQLTVSWDEVSGASGYKVQWKSGTEEFNATDRQHEITGGSTTTYTIPSLAPGTEYTVQVSATKANARVDGAPSAPVTATPKAVSPGQVTGVALIPAAEALQVTWGPVATADGYRVQWRSGMEEFSADRQEEIAGATTATHTIAGLDPDTTYTVQVIATRQFADDGPASPSVSDRPQYQPPARVTEVSVTAGVERFLIIWRVVTDADGYRVQWKSGAEEFSADRQAVPTGDSLRPYGVGGDSFLVQVIPSLIPGTEYTVQVIATRDNAADGEPSEPATGTPPPPAA